MGNKIITEKDFWVCSGGTTPAPFQTTQLSTKKQSQHKYITVADKSTLSWIDFGCKKLMLIMAIIAAVVVVAVVATGGAALGVIIAAGAVAGAAGAAYGAVLGALICGQKAAVARSWLASKNNMIIQGQNAITGDHKMNCAVFGETITFAPHIKNWWQAISLSAANYIGGIMEGMLAGAAIGMGGALLAGGGSALAAGGLRGLGQAGLQLLKSMPRNFLGNAIESVSKVGLALRGVMGAQNTLATYGNTGEAGVGDFARGVVAMETGAFDSVRNIASGNGTWQDFAGIALMFSPVGKGKREIEDGLRNRDGEPTRDADENSRADEEEGTNRPVNQEVDAPRQEGEFEAFEDSPRYGERRISDELYDELRSETPTQEIRDMVNEGVQLPMPDPVLPGLEITKNLHADHIVPMDKITRMEGFDTLTREQQLAVLNNPDNFIGLSESANTSKGPKTYEQWTRHKSRGIDVNPEFRQRMIERERQVELQLQRQIDNLNRRNQ